MKISKKISNLVLGGIKKEFNILLKVHFPTLETRIFPIIVVFSIPFPWKTTTMGAY